MVLVVTGVFWTRAVEGALLGGGGKAAVKAAEDKCTKELMAVSLSTGFLMECCRVFERASSQEVLLIGGKG